jgi:hypothetical protein
MVDLVLAWYEAQSKAGTLGAAITAMNLELAEQISNP